MSDVRALTSHEREVLEFLLQGEWDGSAALRSQLSTARFGGRWSADSASFDLVVDPSAPRAELGEDAAAECVVSGDSGLAEGELFLRVEDGVLVGLECSLFTDEAALPPVGKLLSHADFDARGCTPF